MAFRRAIRKHRPMRLGAVSSTMNSKKHGRSTRRFMDRHGGCTGDSERRMSIIMVGVSMAEKPAARYWSEPRTAVSLFRRSMEVYHSS